MIVNIVINGAIGWAATRSFPHFPVWAAPGVAVDLMATAFGVTFGTWISTSFQVRSDVARQKVSAPELSEALAARIRTQVARLPAGMLRQALWLGLVSIPLFSAPAIAALALSGTRNLERVSFIALKAGFAGVQAAIVTPFTILGLLLHPPGPAAGGRLP